MKKNKSVNFLVRLLFYIGGIFFVALGVRLAIRGNLGISPISSPSYSIFNVFGANSIDFSLFGREIIVGAGESFNFTALDSGWSFTITLGMCATTVFFILILLQILVLRRDFKPINFLQILISTVFGYFVDAAGKIVALIPAMAPQPYYISLIFLAGSILCIATGLTCYLPTKLLPMPSEGIVLAIQQKINKPYHKIKIVTDCVSVAIATIIILLGTGKLTGIREGTVITAVMVGVVMGYLRPVLNPLLRRCGLDAEIPSKKKRRSKEK